MDESRKAWSSDIAVRSLMIPGGSTEAQGWRRQVLAPLPPATLTSHRLNVTRVLLGWPQPHYYCSVFGEGQIINIMDWWSCSDPQGTVVAGMAVGSGLEHCSYVDLDLVHSVRPHYPATCRKRVLCSRKLPSLPEASVHTALHSDSLSEHTP